jgi:predicted peptidase
MGATHSNATTLGRAFRPRLLLDHHPAGLGQACFHRQCLTLAPRLAQHVPETIMRLIACALALCLATTAWAADGFEAKTFTAPPGTLPYCILAPATVAAGTTYPLVLVLHGAGERGTNNSSQLTHGSALFLDAHNRATYPAYVVFPQCPGDKRWVEVDWGDPKPHQMPKEPSIPMSLVLDLLPSLMSSLPVDRSRVYVLGLSMGGFGTWDIIARHPDWFAAAVPICGGADNSTAPRIAGLPIWVFHGGADTTVKTIRSRSMVDALIAAGGKPKYSEVPGVGHDVWNTAFASPELLPWLFAQRRHQALR